MTYITGDTHGTLDVNKLAKICPHLTEDDYILVLGDFGVCWDHNGSDTKVRRFWERLKCTTLFIDGNHENFDLLNAYPVDEWHGGKVQRIGEKIVCLCRGQVFVLDGKTVFTMGGAASHDCGSALTELIDSHLDDYHTYDFATGFDGLPGIAKKGCRIPGKSWWAAEIPSPEEIAEAKENLAKVGNKVDYILTHTASKQVLAARGFGASPQTAEQMAFFDWMEQNVGFGNWWFGHLHEDFYYDLKHIGFYQQIREMT